MCTSLAVNYSEDRDKCHDTETPRSFPDILSLIWPLIEDSRGHPETWLFSNANDADFLRLLQWRVLSKPSSNLVSGQTNRQTIKEVVNWTFSP